MFLQVCNVFSDGPPISKRKKCVDEVHVPLTFPRSQDNFGTRKKNRKFLPSHCPLLKISVEMAINSVNLY
jgi:hypothetical protein